MSKLQQVKQKLSNLLVRSLQVYIGGEAGHVSVKYKNRIDKEQFEEAPKYSLLQLPWILTLS